MCLGNADCEGGGTCEENTNQSISGGHSNKASGDNSTVSGGLLRGAAGNLNWAAGSLWEDH
jgi:hypothetical protein